MDDTSIFFLQHDDPNQPEFHPHQIAQKIEEIAQDFERKLHSTEGNLALPKCFWYLVNGVWDDHGTPTMTTIKQSPATISLTQG